MLFGAIEFSRVIWLNFYEPVILIVDELKVDDEESYEKTVDLESS
jgi:hypothetical protein